MMSERRKKIEKYINQIDSLTLEIAEVGVESSDKLMKELMDCFNCKKARQLAKKLKGDISQSGS